MKEKTTNIMSNNYIIDRKEQSIQAPYNTNDVCVLMYECKCGNNVYDTDNYCSKCGTKLSFVNEPILDERWHYNVIGGALTNEKLNEIEKDIDRLLDNEL